MKLNNLILIVDDEESIHKDFEEMLRPAGTSPLTDELAKSFGSDVGEPDSFPKFELLHAQSGQTAYKIVKESIENGNPIAVAYIDVRMPLGWDGVETARRIRGIDKDIEIVIMTAYNSKPLSEIVHNIELPHKLLYVRKPFAREEVQQITISLVHKWSVEKELAEKNRQLALSEQMLRVQLKDALTKMLSGVLPICAECKRIRDENGNWNQIDAYIQENTNAKFTYSICPECKRKLYPDLYKEDSRYKISQHKV